VGQRIRAVLIPWTGVNTLAGALTAAAFGSGIGVYPSLFAFGLIFGLLQWPVLRKPYGLSRWWMVAAPVAGVVLGQGAIVLGWIVALATLFSILTFILPVMALTAAGAAVEWRFMRSNRPPITWWLSANAAGGMFSSLLWFQAFASQRFSLEGIATGAAAGAIYGAISGLSFILGDWIAAFKVPPQEASSLR
jgi:uncharacterized membrane protein